MNTKLVAYFSATGNTRKLAETLAQAVGADLFEIRPAVAYTMKDLDWRNRESRSSVEMSDPSSRPALAPPDVDLTPYETVFVGFPIWWYQEPTLINTFLESCCTGGKNIIPFATSGGSDMANVSKHLQPSCPDSNLLEGRVWAPDTAAEELRQWAESL